MTTVPRSAGSTGGVTARATASKASTCSRAATARWPRSWPTSRVELRRSDAPAPEHSRRGWQTASVRINDVELSELLDLEPHGPDTYIGGAVSYPWGPRDSTAGRSSHRRCGRRRCPSTPTRPVHSLHAYFIRPGTHAEPVRFEVERLRDGRSFSTRQVVARQSAGAILTASMSFHDRRARGRRARPRTATSHSSA